jgi:hypothetical protein
MTGEIDSQFESCLKTLVEVMELRGNLRNDLRRSIITVSNLREVYNKLLHVVEDRTSDVNNLEKQNTRPVKVQTMPPPAVQKMKYSDVTRGEQKVNAETTKFKLLVKSANN